MDLVKLLSDFDDEKRLLWESLYELSGAKKLSVGLSTKLELLPVVRLHNARHKSISFMSVEWMNFVEELKTPRPVLCEKCNVVYIDYPWCIRN